MRPKPMVEIGGRPILWHIMQTYAHHGFSDFVICLGYRGYMIKEYFTNYFLHSSDVTIEMASGRATYHDTRSEDWRVTLVDTGEATLTAGRIRRVRRFLPDDEPFFLTYGDGVADIDLRAQLRFHQENRPGVTMTVVRPPARFGTAKLAGPRVVAFEEKPQASEGLINGGFFVVEPQALDALDLADDMPWEAAPLGALVENGDLAAYHHQGFWQPMDTLRDKELLEDLWQRGDAPWRTWT